LGDKRKQKRARRATRALGSRAPQPAPVRHDAQGRVHLSIHLDARGRPDGLALSRPVFSERWQNDVTIGAANTAHAFLSAGRTPEQAAALGLNVMAATSKIADGMLARSPDHAPACRAGCAHCCHQAVGVSPPEVLAIHDHLRRTRSAAELRAVVARIRAADDRTRGLSSSERISPDHPCVFLVDDCCSIYEVRPLACRGVNSLDAAACERNLRDPVAHADFVAGRASVPCVAEPIRAFHAVAAGVQLALHELHDLHVLPLDLTAAMRILSDDPDRVARRWLAGEDPFARARGADVSDNDQIGSLVGRAPTND